VWFRRWFSARRHIRHAIRVIAVDSATDEVNSVLDMKELVDGLQPLAPKHEAMLRDKAHGSRRGVSRPWMADPTLRELLFVSYQGSKASSKG
jgi:hypothetical protein